MGEKKEDNQKQNTHTTVLPATYLEPEMNSIQNIKSHLKVHAYLRMDNISGQINNVAISLKNNNKKAI